MKKPLVEHAYYPSQGVTTFMAVGDEEAKPLGPAVKSAAIAGGLTFLGLTLLGLRPFAFIGALGVGGIVLSKKIRGSL